MKPLDSITPVPVAVAATGAPPTLWTVQDVASFLRVPLSWVYERTRRNEIPCLRLGKSRLIRFDPDAIRNWTASTTPRQCA